jgi:hypothetical protein
MAPTLVIGLALALTGSLALNGSYVAQHLGAVHAPAITLRRPLVSLTGLLRSRLWLAGGIAGISGWLLHVGALSRAPLSLVQAFSAGGLALVVPVAARVTGRPLSSCARRGTLVMGAALAALAVGARPVVGAASAGSWSVVAFAVVVAALIAALLTRRRGPHALGVAAGAPGTPAAARSRPPRRRDRPDGRRPRRRSARPSRRRWTPRRRRRARRRSIRLRGRARAVRRGTARPRRPRRPRSASGGPAASG